MALVLRSLVVVIVFVWLYCVEPASLRHAHRHERSRVRRQHEHPRAFVWAEEDQGGGGGSTAEDSEDPSWGPWSHPSSCSRTCGGGVASQNRTCRDGYTCRGSSRRYFSCNIEECTSGNDFRTEQCADYNKIPFEEIYYDWIPYTKAPNKCSLNCMPRGERFYYRHKDKVEDGTRCDDESLDICVDGVCRPVGCDRLLGSSAKEDLCRVCGGDGSNCNTERGILDDINLQVGYNDLLLVPSGATNIKIREIRPSNNYLAVRNTTGFYYLNGNWRIDFPRSLRFAGTVFHYGRKPHGFFAPESITAVGPTNEAIYVVLLYQEANPGVEYEYSIPKGKVLVTDPEGYVWHTDEFSECSTTCGGGYQSRHIWCAKQKDPSNRVSEDLCDSSDEPASTQTCSSVACPPQWTMSDWSACSITCGEGGSQIRQISCEQVMGSGQSMLVNDSACTEVSGVKPATTIACPKVLPCPNWHVGPWKPCDHLCGDGKQRRAVHCYRRVDGRIELHPDLACSAEKPATEKECNLRPCEGVDWVTSDWSGCEQKCGLTFETRTAHCMNQEGKVFADELCHDYRKPALTRECTSRCELKFQWYASQWSDCSSKCGEGVQSRQVYCGAFDGDQFKKAEDSSCDATKRYNDTQPCKGEEECRGEWFIGPFGSCSKPCGGGEMKRKVLCFKDNAVADVKECKPETIPFTVDPCNTHSCGADEIMPVDPTRTIIEEDSEECEEEDYDEEGEGDASDIMMNDMARDAEFIRMQLFDSGLDVRSANLVESIKEKRDSPAEEVGTDSTTDSSTGSSWGLSTLWPFSSTSEETSGPTETSTDSSEPSTDSTSSTMPSSDFTEPSSADSAEPSEGVSGATEPSGATSDTAEPSGVPSLAASPGSTEISLSVSPEAADTSLPVSPGVTEILSPASLGVTEISSPTSPGATDISEPSGGTEHPSSSGATDVSAVSSEATGASEPSGMTEPTGDTGASDTALSSEPTKAESASSVSGETPEVDGTTEAVGTSDGLSTGTEMTAASDLTPETATASDGGSTSVVETSPTMEVTPAGDVTVSSAEASPAASTDAVAETSASGLTETSATAPTDLPEGTVDPGFGLFNQTETTGVSAMQTPEITESSATTDASSLSTDGSSPMDVSTSSQFDLTETPKVTSVSEAIFGLTSPSPLGRALVEEKRKRCRPKLKSKCMRSKFGCCPDNETPATAPFGKGCPVPMTCQETKFGCCPDGVSPADGEGFKGCPPSQCDLTLFGCCPDGVTTAEGNDFEGCPQETTPALVLDCASTQFGCCPDGIISATGPNFEGCMCEGSGGDCELCKDSEFGCCPNGVTSATGPDFMGCEETESTSTETSVATSEIELCTDTMYGCCDDNMTAAIGPNMEGCPPPPMTERTLTCSETEFGCCPDGVAAASGPNREGCVPVCSGGQFGCCYDNVTLAHGPNGEGCCLNTAYGCCPDNILPAQGPNLEGCGCEYTLFGCCPDNSTSALGERNEGCGCRHSAHGCCPDAQTAASGPHYDGCPCYTFQFGCCPDGETRAKGPYHQGCGCEHTEFGCCPDNKTPARGPAKEDCSCEASKYGCCPDGISEATGEDFEGCTKKPVKPGQVCTLPKDRGPCREFSVKWFFDIEYGGCSRFWYGSCEGNGNRFKTQEDCRATCVEAKGRDACYLPKIEGPCKGYYQAWYFNEERKQCGQFIYGGCLGNNNRFQTREECEELCVAPEHLDACEQEVDPGPCNGTFTRWYYDKRTQVCQPFNYGGCKPNKNNFLTESACQVKCMQPGSTKEHCSLAKLEGNCNDRLPKWHFDQLENRCKPFYYSGCTGNANRFDTRQHCEADCPPRAERDTCLLPAEVGDCHDYVERYYFDSFEGRCKMFYYGGCGGNSNNFEIETDCQRRCDSAQIVEKFTHDMCFLPEDSGPCSDSRTKWHYDSRDGVCKQFAYGGCQGNGNRFSSRQDCEHACGRVQDVCSLPMIVGPCEALIEQWYFDPSTDSCQAFSYGGCQGNGNRFESREQCETRCRRDRPRPQPEPQPQPQPQPPPQPATAGPPSQPEFCRAPVDPGPCLKQLFYWYYDPTTDACQQFMYGGCEGNANRFYTEEQCERQCGLSRGHDVCSQERDSGPCRAEVPKWYFDGRSRTCQEFVYGGCRGNSNRFSSRDECNTVCLFNDELQIPPGDNTPNVNQEICRLPPDAGYCSGSHVRWHFDASSGICLRFNFTGCSGNLNNFKTEHDCRQYCEPIQDPNEIDVHTKPDKARCEERVALCEVEMTRCEYGVERWVDEDGCDNCRCHNPCATAADCEPGTKCVVILQANEETGDSVYRAICRPVAKPGECPNVMRESCAEIRNDCNTDADCASVDKCCYDGCGKTCASPVMPHAVTTTTPTPEPQGVQPPEISDESEPEVEAEEGNFATLRCIARGYPVPIITWIRGTILFNNTGGKYRILPGGVLQIIGLVRSDSGVYVCTADNGIGPTVKKEFRLTVKEGGARPASVMGDDDSSVLASLGGAAALHCLALGLPRPAITWWRGSRIIPLNAEGYEQRRDNSLYVRKVTVSDLGYYTCQAYNGLGRAASWSVALRAYGPEGLVQDPNDVNYNQFLVAPPPGFYRPQPLPQPGPPLPPIATTTTTTTTTLRPTVRTFVVPVKASILLDESLYKVGADISIPCDVEGYPVPRVIWYKDGDQIQVSERIRISESNRLIVLGAKIEDTGLYRCHARNDYGEDESAVAIKVEGTYIDPKCTDNQFFANCQLIVQARYCTHKYYAKFCCKSCTEAGHLPSRGPHLSDSRRRRRSLLLAPPPPLVIERLLLPPES